MALVAALLAVARCGRFAAAPVTSTGNPFAGRWQGSENQRYIRIDGDKGVIVFTNGVELQLVLEYPSNGVALAYETNWTLEYYRSILPREIAEKALSVPDRTTWYELRLNGDGTVSGTRYGVWRVHWTKTYLAPDIYDYAITGIQTNLTHEVRWHRMEE